MGNYWSNDSSNTSSMKVSLTDSVRVSNPYVQLVALGWYSSLWVYADTVKLFLISA